VVVTTKLKTIKPTIELVYSDMTVRILATNYNPTTIVDLFLIASAILEKATELEHGTPIVRTNLINTKGEA